jgi:spermidine synthase
VKHPPLNEFPPLTKNQRGFLFYTAGVTGAAVMIIEILGARMLAPYFGTSHYVWTAQIGVTLVALAAGYWIGGTWVDAKPRLDGLYFALAVAAAWLSLVVRMLEPVSYYCLKFPLAWGSIIAAAVLTLPPLVLLAMTGPFLLRLLAPNTTVIGRVSGRLTALSTVGSFLGTALIGYVMIPFLANSISLLLTAAQVALLPALYFAVWRRRAPTSVGSIVVICVGFLMGTQPLWGGTSAPDSLRIVHRSNSHFGQLLVVEPMGGDRRLYLNDYLVQNTYDVTEKRSASMFTYLLEDLARAYAPDLKEVLCLGMGVGIVPMRFCRSGLRTDVVEINPAVVPVARKYFDCDPALFRLFLDDARHFLNQATNRYDVVVLDAFLGDSVPSHLMTIEAFQAIGQVLRPQGVLVMNAFGELPPAADYFRDALARTLGGVFRFVRLHASGNGNLFFVAMNQKPPATLQFPDLDTIHVTCRYQAQTAFTNQCRLDLAQGTVLTDDRNPVEYYDARVRERLRRLLALSMQPQSSRYER